MLDDALARAEREVEAAMPCVALLKTLDDAEGVQIVVEAQTVSLQAAIKSALTGVTKGRMSDVVYQRQGLGEVDVEAKCRGDLASHLSDLDGVRQAAAKMVGSAACEDLRLTREAPEGARLHDAVAVSLEGKAIVPSGRWIGTHREAGAALRQRHRRHEGQGSLPSSVA
jgi:hypothetical protein